ncbi:HLA class II histocompatibility antigen, DM alpha chain [Ornithorhynchus anatinus]|uniref:HLA class II histocompatibility antigen, DM alpha chain n=1 Tax=Ornithorhynchus anatinus TaxID=9258 RepID=UPI0010A7C9A3|nr:HLA class II histocompatibility antigen, DM alpha chain [Ornithorhynchus anatinus]
MEAQPRPRVEGLPLLLLLLLLPLLPLLPPAGGAAPQGDLGPRNHTLLHTLFCQDGEPSLGLSEAFDGDPLFTFDFSGGSRRARLPEFEPWAGYRDDRDDIDFDAELCRDLLYVMTPQLDGRVPENRGIPAAKVFPLEPLRPGRPNALVCSVDNLFPPEAAVGWQRRGAEAETGREGQAGPVLVPQEGLAFRAFAYLDFTPAVDDLYACVVGRRGDLSSTVSYWVPRDVLPSDLLENVLCGLAFGLGVAGASVGVGLLVRYRRRDAGD